MKRPVTPHLLINTPFLEKCDGNRLQIAASQARQALPLKFNEPAFVVTGYERSDVFTDLVKAKKPGEIVFVSNKAIVIKYNKRDYEIIKVYPEDVVRVKEGMFVSPSDVIKEKEHYFHGDEITQGVNLVCAIMSDPLNFEDAFVVSESAAKKLTAFTYETVKLDIPPHKVLLSLDKDKYTIFKDEVKTGELLLRIGHKDFLMPEEHIKAYNDAIVKDITVVPSPKFHSAVREFYLQIMYKYELTKDKIEKAKVPDRIKTELRNIHKVFPKAKKIEGVDNLYLELDVRLEKKLQIGDKLTNRHAAKGIIATIVPDELMPVLSDGRRVEVLLNPMAVPSRMNISQLFEISANRALYNFKQRLKELAKENKIDDMIELIDKFYKLMSTNSEDNWIYKGVKKELDELLEIGIDAEDLANIDWRFIAPGFESVDVKTLQEMLDLASKPLYVLEDLTIINDSNRHYLLEEVELTDEVLERLKEIYNKHNTDINIEDIAKTSKIYKATNFVDVVYYNNNYHLITADYMYFYRLVHLAEGKLSGRSMETYDLAGQPASGHGVKHKTPQRLGEMEVWTLIAYDSILILREFMTTKSDHIGKKLSYIYNKLTGRNIAIDSDPETIKLLKAYLYQLGIVYETEPFFNIEYLMEENKVEI